MPAIDPDPFSLGQMKAVQHALGIAIKTGLNDADLAHVVEVRAFLAYRIGMATRYDDALCECGHRRLHHPRSGACDAPSGYGTCDCVGFVLASRSVDA